MESQEEKYRHSVWEIYRKEWETANPEKRLELNKRMLRWQELMKSGLTAQQAYMRVMEVESDETPTYTLIEEDADVKVQAKPSGEQLAISSSSGIRKSHLIILGIALVAAIVYGVFITVDRNALETELESVQSTLASTQAELNTTRGTLISTNAELNSTKQTLTSTVAELSDTKQTLSSTQTELGDTRQKVVSTQSELTNTKQTLASTQQQLSVAQETLGGLGITLYASKQCSDVVLVDNPKATNPTWSRLMTFLSEDHTEDRTYVADLYDCSQFSRDVHNNAEARGIQTAEVQIKFRNESVGHALNAFITTDKGLVYVDCTGGDFQDRMEAALYRYTIDYDKIAFVKKGRKYCAFSMDRVIAMHVSPEYFLYLENYEEILKYSPSYGWMPSGIVESIRIYW